MTSETMFLVKGRTLLGRCVKYPKGWRFLSDIPARGNSRRYWPSAIDSIPRWAFDMSDNLLTDEEWQAWRVKRVPFGQPPRIERNSR